MLRVLVVFWLNATLICSLIIIFIRLAVVDSKMCEIPRNSPKIRTYSSSRSPKIIELGANRRRICNFLLVIDSNFGRIFSYRFRDTDAFYISFSQPRPCLTPPSGGTICDINIFYTPLESTFNGLQFRRFIRVAVVGSQIYELPQNSERISPCSSSR